MKKNYFLLALTLVTSASFAQKVLLVNGGQFGNSQENANVVIYDTQSQNYSVIDTIHTQSVQDILVDSANAIAYVAAQDSIISYDLNNEQRIAANSFQGVSTKTLALHTSGLLVGNWYGQTTNNLQLYNSSTLALIDTFPAVTKGVNSILVHRNDVYVVQNEQTSSFTDTLGYVLQLDITTRNIIDTIVPTGYTEGMGQLLKKSDNSGFYVLNSGTNTISSYDFTTQSISNTAIALDFSVGSTSNYDQHQDTLFVRRSNGIGSINLNGLSIIDSLIIDTVVTAFTYDQLNSNFYLTQTDFFSYRKGGIYNRQGSKIDTFMVGYSPEVIEMYYNTTVGMNEVEFQKVNLTLYPNPAQEYFKLEWEEIENVVDLEIYNQLGALVYVENDFDLSKSVALNNMNKGIYFVTIRSDEKLAIHKLIVN
ncbi:MAG: T9SS type A sorting domain-containing protein [Vicingaceae bacterium]